MMQLCIVHTFSLHYISTIVFMILFITFLCIMKIIMEMQPDKECRKFSYADILPANLWDSYNLHTANY